jgi:hypothetical protein
LRDKLLNEIAVLDATDAAIEWAGRSVGAKNILTTEDASLVETAFRNRMRVLELEAYPPDPMASELPTPPSEIAPQPESTAPENPSVAEDAREPQKPMKLRVARMRVERSSNLTSVKPRRFRDKDHLRFIAMQPCTACGRQPCEAHHLRFTQPRALGRRVSDEFTVPLCRVHHRELHRQGDERAWWNKANIDPMPIALRFWRHTRGVPQLARSDDKLQNPKTDVPIAPPSVAGAGSIGNTPSELFDGGTIR